MLVQCLLTGNLGELWLHLFTCHLPCWSTLLSCLVIKNVFGPRILANFSIIKPMFDLLIILLSWDWTVFSVSSTVDEGPVIAGKLAGAKKSFIVSPQQLCLPHHLTAVTNKFNHHMARFNKQGVSWIPPWESQLPTTSTFFLPPYLPSPVSFLLAHHDNLWVLPM